MSLIDNSILPAASIIYDYIGSAFIKVFKLRCMHLFSQEMRIMVDRLIDPGDIFVQCISDNDIIALMEFMAGKSCNIMQMPCPPNVTVIHLGHAARFTVINDNMMLYRIIAGWAEKADDKHIHWETHLTPFSHAISNAIVAATEYKRHNFITYFLDYKNYTPNILTLMALGSPAFRHDFRYDKWYADFLLIGAIKSGDIAFYVQMKSRMQNSLNPHSNMAKTVHSQELGIKGGEFLKHVGNSSTELESALCGALINCNTASVRYLVAKGAKISGVSTSDLSPRGIVHALQMGVDVGGVILYNPAFLASTPDVVAATKHIAIEKLFELAAMTNKVETMRTLYHMKKDMDTNKALRAAVDTKAYEAVRLLITWSDPCEALLRIVPMHNVDLYKIAVKCGATNIREAMELSNSIGGDYHSIGYLYLRSLLVYPDADYRYSCGQY